MARPLGPERRPATDSAAPSSPMHYQAPPRRPAGGRLRGRVRLCPGGGAGSGRLAIRWRRSLPPIRAKPPTFQKFNRPAQRRIGAAAEFHAAALGRRRYRLRRHQQPKSQGQEKVRSENQASNDADGKRAAGTRSYRRIRSRFRRPAMASMPRRAPRRRSSLCPIRKARAKRKAHSRARRSLCAARLARPAPSRCFRRSN